MKPSVTLSIGLRRLFVLLGVTLLSGCAGSGTAPSLYLLSDDSARAPAVAADAPRLVVDPVMLAPVLDVDGLLYQIAPHQVAIANDHRWAAPLATQLRDTLIETLAGQLEMQVVRRSGPGQGVALRLKPRVETFMGHYDGHARIAGRWEVETDRGEIRLARPFEREIPLSQDGYDALVVALSAGWQQAAVELATTLKALDAPTTGR